MEEEDVGDGGGDEVEGDRGAAANGVEEAAEDDWTRKLVTASDRKRVPTLWGFEDVTARCEFLLVERLMFFSRLPIEGVC